MPSKRTPPSQPKPGYRVEVSISEQVMEVFDDEGLILTFPVSTALNGTGFEEGSNKTPTGRFEVVTKIGDDLPLRTIFESRVPKGVWSPKDRSQSKADLILSRILWLGGLDSENANTQERYIYIHGTNHEDLIGTPVSHGCIRLRNEDVVALYDRIPLATLVVIE